MRKIVSLILSVVLMTGCFGMSVLAEEVSYPKTMHTYTVTEDYASDEWSTAQRGAYLGNGTSSIARASSSTINISGSTNATQVCDTVRLTLYVERSTSYSTGYTTYKSYSYSGNDVYQIVKGISNIPVESGYYYRVAGVHSVTHNGVIETNNSVTNPLDYR